MVDLLSARRRVGQTALELPAFGFGSAHLGELYNRVDEADARATLEAAWADGVRFYDTAPWYGRGLSEHRLGGFLRTKPRSEFQLTTKVGRTLHRPKEPARFDRSPWVGGLNFEVNFDYSYDGVMRSYEQALQRLAIDTVDALVVHDLDESFHGETYKDHLKALIDGGGMRALDELKTGGDIQAIGMGINTDHALEAIATRVDLDFALVAMPYTLIDQASLHTGMAACVKRGVSVIIGAPFASGILVTGSGSGAQYRYAKASAGGAGESARTRGGLPDAWRRAAGRCAAIRPRPSRRRLDHPRRGAPERGDAEYRLAARADPCGLLVGSQGSGSDREGCACSGRRLGQADDVLASHARRSLLSARGVSKRFAAVEVLRDVDLDLRQGEIHALLGENGAGKSTFAKIIAGVHRPSRGALALNGRTVDVASPIVAQRLGITLIHQEPISFPDLSVAENLVLGRHDGSPLVARAVGADDARRAGAHGHAGRLDRRLEADAGPFDRRPADGRDRARARLRQPADHHGRADRAAHPEGGRKRCSPSRAGCATRAERSSSSRTGSRKCGRSATGSPSSATAQRLRPRRSTLWTTRDIIRLMIGRPLREYMHKHGRNDRRGGA